MECHNCSLDKDEREFPVYHAAGTRKVCLKCRKSINRRYEKKGDANRSAKFLAILDQAKTGVPCGICNRSYPAACMDLDHIDPSLKPATYGRSIRNMCRLGAKKAVALLALCKVICSNCHRIRTEQESHHLKGQIPVERTPKNQKTKRRVVAAKAYIRASKTDHPCKDCGEKFPAVCMDYDHLRDKTMNISAMVRMKCSVVRIQREIEKCELVCSNCHRLRTLILKVLEA